MKSRHKLTREEIQAWMDTDGETAANAEEVVETENALLGFCQDYSAPPSREMRSKILSRMNTLHTQKSSFKKLDINKLPLLDENSNWLEWQEMSAHLAPPVEGYDGEHLHQLESEGQRSLFVVWLKEEVVEEVHHDELESFLILEGSCVCNIRNTKGEKRSVRLGAGDFITMQVGEHHDVTVTSYAPVKAILQRIKVG